MHCISGLARTEHITERRSAWARARDEQWEWVQAQLKHRILGMAEAWIAPLIRRPCTHTLRSLKHTPFFPRRCTKVELVGGSARETSPLSREGLVSKIPLLEEGTY